MTKPWLRLLAEELGLASDSSGESSCRYEMNKLLKEVKKMQLRTEDRFRGLTEDPLMRFNFGKVSVNWTTESKLRILEFVDGKHPRQQKEKEKERKRKKVQAQQQQSQQTQQQQPQYQQQQPQPVSQVDPRQAYQSVSPAPMQTLQQQQQQQRSESPERPLSRHESTGKELVRRNASPVPPGRSRSPRPQLREEYRAYSPAPPSDPAHGRVSPQPPMQPPVQQHQQQQPPQYQQQQPQPVSQVDPRQAYQSVSPAPRQPTPNMAAPPSPVMPYTEAKPFNMQPRQPSPFSASPGPTGRHDMSRTASPAPYSMVPSRPGSVMPVNQQQAPYQAYQQPRSESPAAAYAAQQQGNISRAASPYMPPQQQQQQNIARAHSPAPPRAASPMPPAAPPSPNPYRAVSPAPSMARSVTMERPVSQQSTSTFNGHGGSVSGMESGAESDFTAASYQSRPRSRTAGAATPQPQMNMHDMGARPASRAMPRSAFGQQPQEQQARPQSAFNPDAARPASAYGGSQMNAESGAMVLGGGDEQQGIELRDPSKHYSRDGRQILYYVRARYAYGAAIMEELSFHKGDILAVIREQDDGWWEAEIVDDDSQPGLVPSNYLTPLF